jgi:hypothetical protein
MMMMMMMRRRRRRRRMKKKVLHVGYECAKNITNVEGERGSNIIKPIKSALVNLYL